MHKKRAKEIVEQVHQNIMNKIEQLNTSDEIDGQVFLEYLHEIASRLVDTSDAMNEDERLMPVSFEKEYKNIADSSLDSYAITSDKLCKFTQEQQEIIDHCKSASELIDANLLTNKFTEIQTHMEEEVKRANLTIESLNSRVKDLELQSSLDPLTKVFNRKALNSYFETICSKGFKGTHILMIDIDDFKRINDTYGHLAGDKVIIYLSKMLSRTLRDGDKIFRYGGEEFVVVLNRIDEEKCLNISSRIVKMISSSNLIYKEFDIKMTISIGATSLRKNDTMHSVLDRADRALYRAKNSGKNRLEIEQ